LKTKPEKRGAKDSILTRKAGVKEKGKKKIEGDSVPGYGGAAWRRKSGCKLGVF